jgi:hypothetical protein
MMSTAVLMAMEAGQTSVRPASPDRGETEGMSFAQSLNERVGASTEMLRKRPTGEMPTRSPSVKDEPAVKTPDVVATMSHEVKGKAMAAREGGAYGEVEGEAGLKNVAPQTVTVAVSQPKTIVRDPEMKNVQSPAEVELATESSSIATQEAKGLNLKEETFLSQVDAAGEDQPLALSSEEVVVQKGTSTTGKTQEVVPAKKTSKSQKGEVEPIGLQKIATTLHPAAIAARPTMASVAQNQAMGQTVMVDSSPGVTDGATPKGEISSTSDGGLGRGISLAGKRSFTGTIATKDSLVRKDGTTPGIDVENGLPLVSDSAGSPNPSTGVEKLTVGTMIGSDGTVKTDSSSWPVTAIVHAMTGSTEMTSSVVAPGNAPSDASVMKLPAGEAGGHTVGLPAGLREQNSSDIIAGSMDGMPQTLKATPTALEVGIQNGTHGWLKVRAEMTDGGVVNASVSAASTAGQEMLHRELPALTAYLQSEKVAVDAVVVHSTAPNVQGGGAGMDGGSGGQMQQEGNDGGGHQKGITETALHATDQVVSCESLNEIDDVGPSPLATYVGGGSWLSVRA